MKFGYVLVIVGILAAMGVSSVVFPEGVGAILMIAIVSAVVFPLVVNNSSDPQFVSRIFFAALATRVLFGMIIYTFDLSGFFGPDALTYHDRGSLIADYWHGLTTIETPFLTRILSTSGSGWGMHYLVGSIYYVIGKNQLAAQAFCWVFGAAIGPVVYICSYRIYKNSEVSKFAAIVTAFFPAFIIWSAQLMKDGLIIFLLVVVIIAVLRLQQKFSIEAILLLVLAMFGILSLRFYIFYMVAIAVVGSFVIGLTNDPAAILRRTAILLVAGIGLTYLGVLRTASVDLEQYGTLESVQRSRSDLAGRSESGYGDDVDVSTAEGAVTAIPIGFAYLMFAPFPWQVGSVRQAIAIPETILWWGMFPLLIARII